MIFTGYADGLKESLFSMDVSEMKLIFDKYNARVPEPLNRQFQERLTKTESVQKYNERKQRSANLYPDSKFT